MQPGVRARLVRVVVTSGLVLAGTLGVTAPASSAPDACKPGQDCQTDASQATGKPKGTDKPEEPAGSVTSDEPAAEQPEEPAEPEKPEPDLEAPPPPLLGEPTPGPEGLVELPVTAEKDATLVVTEDDTRVVERETATGSVQVLSWTTATGTHTYSVTVTDKAKNVSATAATSVEADATAPKVRRFAARSGSGSDTRSRLELTTEPGTTYRLYVGDEKVAEGTTENGDVEKTLRLADGHHRLKIELEDEVGNVTTDTRPFLVRIPELDVDAELDSDVTDPVQVVRIEARAARTGVIEVAGERDRTFELTRGVAEVELDLADGSYQDVTVTVRDTQGRTGTTTLPDITVDTTAPALTVRGDQVAADAGRMSVEVRTDESTVVSWRLLDVTGALVDSGKYIALDRPQTIERDVDEGSYELEVSATDTYGRTTVERLSTHVAADPLSTTTIVLAGLGLLALVSSLVAGVVVLWRRRRAGQDSTYGGSDGAAGADGAHGDAHAAWSRRHEALSRLLAVARGGVLEDSASSAAVAGVELLPGETVLHATAAGLTDMVQQDGRPGVAVEVDRGELLVTSQRLAFVGALQRRDWWYTLVGRVAHVDHRHTAIELWDSETRSGVAYDDPEVTRLYIDLAMVGQKGSREAYVAQLEQGLRDHEMRRPDLPYEPSGL